MKKYQKNKASVLVISMLILGAVITIALSLTLVALKERKTSISSSRSQVAYQMADEGVETVMNALLKVNSGVSPRAIYSSTANPDGTLTIKKVLAQRSIPDVSALTGSCTTSDCCYKPDGKIYGPGNKYIVTLSDIGGGPILCDDDLVDISNIKNIKSVGYDLNSQTSRAISALADQKSQSLKLFLDMDETAPSDSPKDVSRMHNSVISSNNVNNPSYLYDSDVPYSYGYRSLFFRNTNVGYFRILSSDYSNLSKDLNFTWDTDMNKSSAGFTIDFWVKVENSGSNDVTRSIISLKNTSSSQIINLAYVKRPSEDNGIRLTIKTPSTNFFADFETSTKDLTNSFRHIALIRNPGTTTARGPIMVYIDGRKATDIYTTTGVCDTGTAKSCTFDDASFLGEEIDFGGSPTADTDPTGIASQENFRGKIDLLRITRSERWGSEFSAEVDGTDMDKLYE
jgi:hypothetical protein